MPWLRISGPKSAPADGADLDVVVKAFEGDGRPGTGEVVVEAEHGTFDGTPGSVTVVLAGGEAHVAYRCDYLQGGGCSGNLKITARWRDAQARLSTCLWPTCAQLGKDCDAVPSACGELLECGVCAKPLRCAGAGTPNVCEQPPFEPACSKTGWCWENPVPRGGWYTAIAASAPNDVWAGTGDGQFVHWDGKRWAGVPSPATVTIQDIHAAAPDDATAVDYHCRALHWDGVEWRHLNDWEGYLLENAKVVSSTDIWAFELLPLASCPPTGPKRALHWDGTKWSQVPHPSDFPTDAWAFSATEVWGGAACGGQMSVWDGTSWTLPGIPNVVHPQCGYLFGFSSRDVWLGTCHLDGAEWLQTLTGLGYENWYDRVGGVAVDDLWALRGGNMVDDGEHFYTRRWNGAAWLKFETELDFDLNALRGFSPSDLTAVGGSGIAHWDGTRWSEVSRAARKSRSADLVSVCSVSETESWAAGTGGFYGGSIAYLMRSDASGRWSSQSDAAWHVPGEPPKVLGLNGLWCHESGAVWAVGREGRVLRRDGGAWAVLSVGKNVDLRHVWGAGPDDVWVVGDASAYHWDGKRFQNWPASSEIVVHLQAVYGSGPSDVWAVGGGSLYHFDGTDWVAYENPAKVALRDVWLSGPSDGWAVGDDGTILHYDGANWQKVPNPVDGSHFNQLRGVSGRSATDVWVVGNDALLHWDGTAWSRVDIGVHAYHSSLGSIDVDRWGQVRVVGLQGTVLHLVR